jgi:hypothetical protein
MHGKQMDLLVSAPELGFQRKKVFANGGGALNLSKTGQNKT